MVKTGGSAHLRSGMQPHKTAIRFETAGFELRPAELQALPGFQDLFSWSLVPASAVNDVTQGKKLLVTMLLEA
eukprot:122171-Pelagomonas_calceolata.AAC.6